MPGTLSTSRNALSMFHGIVVACRVLNRSRAALALIFGVLFVLTSGCANQEAEPAFRFGLATAPSNLDPRFATDAASSRINRLLYERLVDFDEAFHPVARLATWQMLSPTHFRFHLTEHGREFHDGSRLTASDVKATYDFILDPGNASPHRSSLAHIAHIEIPDEETVDFVLERPDLLFPNYLVIGILPVRLLQENHPFHTHPVGSGPFAFHARPDESRLQLMRRKDQRIIEFVYVPDPTVRVLKILAGEIHMMQNDLPSELIPYLIQQEGITVQRGPGSTVAYLGFNHVRPPTQQLIIRQAIAHAIDRNAIIQHVLGGSARPATSLLFPTHWAGNSALRPYQYDPDRARALLAQAGFTSAHPLELTYKTSNDPFRIRLATILQDQLAQVDVHVKIRSYDWGTFYGDVKAGRFEMYSLAWVGVHSPDIFSYVFHSQSVPPRGANRGRFRNMEVDRLIERAESALDLTAKQDTYRQLQALLLEQLPIIPLWYEDHVFVSSSRIEGYHLSIDGNFDGLATVHWRDAV